MTPEEIAAHLNHNHIAKAAEWAAGSLARSGHAHLILTPGDATRYEIILLRTARWNTEGVIGSPDMITMGTSFGSIYPWHGHRMHHGYVIEKWVADGGLWTGVVLTEFLNALSEAIKEPT